MKQLHIAVLFNRAFKALWDKTAGVFAYAGKAPDWELHFILQELTFRDVKRHLASLHPDGLIALLPLPKLQCEYPIVTIDVPEEQAERTLDAAILCDNESIGVMAAKHLLARGFRNFAYVGTKLKGDEQHSSKRYDAFARTVKANGGRLLGTYYAQPFQSTSQSLQTWLRDLPKPCGIFVYMDFICQTVLVTCQRAQLEIPGQLGIVSVDNEVAICENSTPTLTSIEPSFVQAGYRAAELLDHFIRNGKPSQPIFETYGIKAIHERMSTQNTAGPMNLINAVNECIRLSATQGLTVSKLAKMFDISTRMLEYRYKSILGRSVQSELIRVKLEAVKNLLATTAIPIGELSQLTGFGTSANLGMAFRKAFGTSMRDWRRTHTL